MQRRAQAAAYATRVFEQHPGREGYGRPDRRSLS
jgi:hypothetical protein